jgi:hypothetical protein
VVVYFQQNMVCSIRRGDLHHRASKNRLLSEAMISHNKNQLRNATMARRRSRAHRRGHAVIEPDFTGVLRVERPARRASGIYIIFF